MERYAKLIQFSIKQNFFTIYPPLDGEVVSVLSGSKRIGVTVSALTVCKNKDFDWCAAGVA